MARTNKSRYYVSTVTDLSDGVLFCRSYGHAWDVGIVNRFSPVGREVWVVKLRCTSCSKERTDYVEPGTFELEERHYTRVDGYTPLDGAGRKEFREEAIRRLYERQGRRDLPVPSERVAEEKSRAEQRKATASRVRESVAKNNRAAAQAG